MASAYRPILVQRVSSLIIFRHQPAYPTLPLDHAIIMPDANPQFALNSIVGAAFGAAGQRCMSVYDHRRRITS